MTTPPDRNRVRAVGRRPATRWFVGALLVLVAGTLGIAAEQPTATAVTDGNWLGIVNTYRAMSGLAPVTANQAWSADAVDHSCYMLQNGISHDETPGKPGYTPDGDIAGNSGNVAVSSSIGATARDHIDLWMTGPFHALGILRPNLVSSGFGTCQDASTPTWHSGATLDVLRGLDAGKPRPSSPVLFPGDGATVPLFEFVTESPNPLDYCGWTGDAGLPLIAMMPKGVSSANATLSGPNGPLKVCTLHQGNTDGTAASLLGGDNAVVVVPRAPLADGVYTATVQTDGGNVTWKFEIDRDAELSAHYAPLPTTTATSAVTRFDPVTPFRLVDTRQGKNAVRLAAGKPTSIRIAGSDVKAVSANFTIVNPAAHGYLTAYDCTSDVPAVSTVGYSPGQVLANQAIVPLDDGELCLFSLRATDVLIDVNGYYRAGSGGGFVPVDPNRLYDSRNDSRLRAGEERAVRVTDVAGGAPGGATSVALNVTAVKPSANGHVKVYPCGQGGEISNINYVSGEVRPNSVVVPVDAKGRVCVRTLQASDVIVDITGYFVRSGGLDFVPLRPIRLLDTRSINPEQNPVTDATRIRAGKVARLPIAGKRGVPRNAAAVSVNLTAVGPASSTFVTAYPCGDRPLASNLNIAPSQGVAANQAMVKLSSGGDLCLYAPNDVHVIVDINGAWR